MTNRPQQVFLFCVRRGGYIHCGLAWKQGSTVSWVDAARSPQSIQTINSPDAQPLTCASVPVELRSVIRAGHCTAIDLTSQLGGYYSRIWRPEVRDGACVHDAPFAEEAQALQPAIVSGIAAAQILFDELADVLKVIEPTTPQLGTYGQTLRHLLIVACTEVESAWRSVLDANHATPIARPTTNDYVKLAEPMRLRDWTLTLTRAAAPLPFSPFAAWSAQQPTASLGWYDAYNATKHGRELHLDQASLQHVLDALAALHILLAAQFGVQAIHWLRSPFHVERAPRWEAHEWYVPDPFGRTWRRLSL